MHRLLKSPSQKQHGALLLTYPLQRLRLGHGDLSKDEEAPFLLEGKLELPAEEYQGLPQDL